MEQLGREADHGAMSCRLLAATGDDVRQPLIALRLHLDMLREVASSPVIAETVAKMTSCVASVEGLLASLLAFSRLEAGLVAANPLRFEVAPLVLGLAEEMEPAAAAKGLALKVFPRPVALWTDPLLLAAILREMLGNAIKYTDRGGLLLGCRRRGAHLSIEVWDTGHSIPEDQLGPIFQDFHQQSRHAADPSLGLGLGLASVDRMARLLGLEVTVRSRPGRGSVFAVLVPLAP